MRKFASLLLAVVTLSVFTVSVCAFGVDPKFQVDGVSVSTLADAFGKTTDAGSVIQQIGDDQSVYPTSENIVVTNDVTLITGKNFGNTVRRIEYSGNDKPLFTVRNGGKLTLQYSEISLSDTGIVGNGKLIVVEQGGTLVLDGTDTEPVTFTGSRDGLILVKDGGKLLFYGATFNGNPSYGDIQVEDGGVIMGDLNGDRVIDGADFYQMSKYVESHETVSISFSPDFDRDGNINRDDFLILMKYLAEQQPTPDAEDISDKNIFSAIAKPDETVKLLFTPKADGKCTFTLPDGEETKLWYILREKSGDLIDCGYYDSGDGRRSFEHSTFEISAEIIADTEYYFEIGTVKDEEIAFDMGISLPQPKTEPVDGAVSPAASVLSQGSLWIILVVAVLAIGGVAALVIVKKKKKPALASGAENTDEE